ncbi:leucine-rich repeat family protein [Tanacetum coccineum]
MEKTTREECVEGGGSNMNERREERGNKLTVLSKRLVASWTLLTEVNAGKSCSFCSIQSKNALSGIPESIGCLSRLIRLDLHQNKITSVPSLIKGCSKLAEFYMGYFSVRVDNANIASRSLKILKEYPVDACKLKLSVLDLSNNSLFGLPAEIGKFVIGKRSSLVSGPTSALLRFLQSILPAEEESGPSESKEKVIAMASRLSLGSKELSLVEHGLSVVPPQVCVNNKISLTRDSDPEVGDD